MYTEIEPKLLEKLSIMLYPESLEQFSKVITILNEDFSFKGEDLFQLKEISKLFSTKELLYNYLTHLSKQPNPIISINEDFSKIQILISDKLVYYQFINIPPEYNDERVKLFLSIKDEEILRLYKSSIFWVLISENEEFNNTFQKTLGNFTVDKEGKKLKYNITSAVMIKKMAKKAIEKRIYNQETENLKNNQKKSEKNEEFNRSKKSDDNTMSWRKKSDISNEKDDLGYGYNNNYYKNNRRQRFKSDPTEYQGNDYYYNNKKNYNDYYYQNDVEELRTQLDEVKYPIFIKEKYNNKDILDYLAKIKNDLPFDEKNFVNIIDEIIDKDKMKNLELEGKKEYEVPKNNPLLNFRKGK